MYYSLGDGCVNEMKTGWFETTTFFCTDRMKSALLCTTDVANLFWNVSSTMPTIWTDRKRKVTVIKSSIQGCRSTDFRFLLNFERDHHGGWKNMLRYLYFLPARFRYWEPSQRHFLDHRCDQQYNGNLPSCHRTWNSKNTTGRSWYVRTVAIHLNLLLKWRTFIFISNHEFDFKWRDNKSNFFGINLPYWMLI